MKKLFFIALLVCGLPLGVQAQGCGFNLGAYLGFPASGSDYTSFSVGLDANYLFEINEKFAVGPATGFSHSFGKDYYGVNEDVQFIPVAAAGRFNINDKMSVGVDLGYAIGVSDGDHGGFYYRPLFGYNITEMIQLNASYIGVSRSNNRYYDGFAYYSYGSTFGIASIGATFNL